MKRSFPIFPLPGIWVTLFLLTCGKEKEVPSPSSLCDIPGNGVNEEALLKEDCPKLSSYRLVFMEKKEFGGREIRSLRHAPQAIPYDVNSALFSDYAYKYRTIYIPSGKKAEYDPQEILSMPVGTVITKTFYYPEDLRDPTSPADFLETRLLIHREEGWVARTYVWDEKKGEAYLKKTGVFRPTRWTTYDGTPTEHIFYVPDLKQCEGCHSERGVLEPIGPKARQLNRTFPYPEGEKNQLQYMAEKGVLSGLPPLSSVPRLPPWEDHSFSITDRVRGYLEANCAHCHNPKGPAKNSGLYLYKDITDPIQIGICKPPVAAGRGTGPGMKYDIAPGDPEHSILLYRMISLDPSVMMPEIGRRLSHWEAIHLVREWIQTLPNPPCP